LVPPKHHNLRDYLTDRDVNKLTLAARFGKTFGRFEILILFFIVYGLNFYWVYHQRYYAGFLPFLSLPLALKVISGIFHEEPSPLYNSFLGRSAGVQLLFGILLSIGLIL
jgi:1,4-dihydroxy-2-naphthoate octaprenyltransferase